MSNFNNFVNENLQRGSDDRCVATAIIDKDIERPKGKKNDVKSSAKAIAEPKSEENDDRDQILFKILITAYIASWVGFYLLVHHNKEAKNLSSAPSMIVMVEIVKLIFALSFYCKSHSLEKFLYFFHNRRQLAIELKRYMPIAALYAICNNNLMIFNLRNNHPIVYQILSSSRLLMVALAWQVLFQVQIPQKRKVALGLITAGFVIKCLKINVSTKTEIKKTWADSAFATLLVLLQMTCSVMASVYNEKILKQVDCDQYLQNICLYLNSIMINLFVFASFSKDVGQEPPLLSKTTIAIVFTLAAAGLMTAMILRSAGSVTKCVVTASITVVTCFIDVVFFDYHLVGQEAVAVVLVTMGSAMYSLDFDNIRTGIAQETKNTYTLGIVMFVFRGSFRPF